MSFPRCEFFASRQGQSDEEEADAGLAASPRASPRRGYYRFLDDASGGIRSFSLCSADSMSSLSSLMPVGTPKPLKVFFINTPGREDRTSGVDEAMDCKAAVCKGLGLEALFFNQDAETVPRILRSRATAILENRCETLLRSCDVACIDLSCGEGGESQLAAWQLGFLAALRTPVLGYGQPQADGSKGGAPDGPSDADLCLALVVRPSGAGREAEGPGAPRDAYCNVDPGETEAAHPQALHDALRRFLESLPPQFSFAA